MRGVEDVGGAVDEEDGDDKAGGGDGDGEVYFGLDVYDGGEHDGYEDEEAGCRIGRRRWIGGPELRRGRLAAILVAPSRAKEENMGMSREGLGEDWGRRMMWVLSPIPANEKGKSVEQQY
ncbi:hypothetical protein LINPERPRIM_LOCUS32169 [Linum perenne]